MPRGKMILRSLAGGTLLLGIGAAATVPTQVHMFKHTAERTDPKAGGRAVVRPAGTNMLETTLTLTGLTPRKAYAAHYHALGPGASSDPCASNGPVTLGFPPFTASATGRATVKVTAEASKLAGNAGAYINVHAASDLKVVPLCAAVRRAPPAARSSAAPPPSVTPAPATSTAAVNVAIGDHVFQPRVITVKTGTTVTWKHQGAALHNVISLTTPSLRSDDLKKGESYSYTFSKAGTYEYYCSYHEGMNGTIIVTD